jgi:tetratricopeptide (TPR) repeat protein
VIGAAALLLTAVVLLAVGIVLINQEKGRTAAAYDRLEGEQTRTENALAAEAKRRQQTRAALDLLSSQVVDEWLAKQRELLPEHRKFLEKAVASYEELARDTGQEEATRAGVARAYLRVANIRSRLGQTVEAEGAYLRSRELYEQLAAEFCAAPVYRQELATTHNNLANLLAATGRTQDAEVAYRNALDLKKHLADDFPAVPGYLDELAKSHYWLGRLFYDTGRKDLAEQAYQRSLALCQRLADAYPQVAYYQAKLGQSHTILGILYNATGRAESARHAYLQDRAIRQRLADLYPQAPEHQMSLAASYVNLAILDRDAGRTDAAEKGFLQAREILQPVVEAYPQVPEYQLYLAACHNNLGTLYRATARADLAEQAFQQAAAIYQQLVGAHPEIADYTIQLGGISWNLGHLLRENLNKPQAALDAYARGIPPLQALLNKDPRQAKAREVLINVYGGRAVALATLGRHAEAEQELERATEVDQGQSRGPLRFFGGSDIRLFRARVLALAGDHVRAAAEIDALAKEKTLPGVDLHFLAITYALALSAGQQDAKLTQAERVSLSERYAANAIELLRKAQATGYFRNAAAVNLLHSAKELAVLRSREDFQKLVKELEESSNRTSSDLGRDEASLVLAHAKSEFLPDVEASFFSHLNTYLTGNKPDVSLLGLIPPTFPSYGGAAQTCGVPWGTASRPSSRFPPE